MQLPSSKNQLDLAYHPLVALMQFVEKEMEPHHVLVKKIISEILILGVDPSVSLVLIAHQIKLAIKTSAKMFA